MTMYDGCDTMVASDPGSPCEAQDRNRTRTHHQRKAVKMKRAISLRVTKATEYMLGELEARWYGTRTTAIEAAVAGWFWVMSRLEKEGQNAIGHELIQYAGPDDGRPAPDQG